MYIYIHAYVFIYIYIYTYIYIYIHIYIGGGMSAPLDVSKLFSELNVHHQEWSSTVSPHSTPRTSRTPRDESSQFDMRNNHDEKMPEFKEPSLKPHASFHTYNHFQTERVEEKALNSYYNARMQALVAGLQQGHAKIAQQLAALQNKLDAAKAAVGPAAACEDHRTLSDGVVVLNQLEIEVAGVRTGFARMWTQLEYANVDELLTAAMNSLREQMVKHTDAASTLVSDLGVFRTEHLQQIAALKRIRQRRMVRPPSHNIHVCVFVCVYIYMYI